MSVDSPREWLMPPEPFEGTVTIEGHDMPLSLEVAIDLAGELVFDIDPIPASANNEWLVLSNVGDLGEYAPNLRLDVHSKDGSKKLSSETVYIVRHRSKISAECVKLHIGITAHRACVITKPKKHTNHPMVISHLVGFGLLGRGFTLPTELGELRIFGNPPPQKGEISGRIALISNDKHNQDDNWRAKAKKLVERVRIILGFARGTPLRSPMVDFFHGDKVYVEFNKNTPPTFGMLPPFREYTSHLKPLVKSLISSIESMDEEKWVGITMAINMLTERSHYDELSLIIRTTAIEVLLKKVFCIKAGSLKEKIINAFKQGKIEHELIEEKEIGRVTDKRKEIIHHAFGVSNDREADDLRETLRIATEIVVVMVLSAIGFSGEYWCYIGKAHRRRFPPVPSSNTQE